MFSERQFEPREDLVALLMELGFDDRRVKQALFWTGNTDADLAASWLFEHPDGMPLPAYLSRDQRNNAGQRRRDNSPVTAATSTAGVRFDPNVQVDEGPVHFPEDHSSQDEGEEQLSSYRSGLTRPGGDSSQLMNLPSLSSYADVDENVLEKTEKTADSRTQLGPSNIASGLPGNEDDDSCTEATAASGGAAVEAATGRLARVTRNQLYSAASSLDPVKMVLIVNDEFKMGVGKIASQVAHGAVALYDQLIRIQHSSATARRLLHQWAENGHKKIVLRAKSTLHIVSLADVANSFNLDNFVVQDAGRTQVPAGTASVLAIIGHSSVVDQCTGQLKLL